MEPPVDLDELMERVRAAVDAQRHDHHPANPAPARPARPPIAGTLSPLAAPSEVPEPDRARAALDLALAEAAVLLPKAASKTSVRRSVPRWLRPLCRNQGGFNGVVLELFECLLEANQQLRRQNLRLQDRLDALEARSARPPEG